MVGAQDQWSVSRGLSGLEALPADWRPDFVLRRGVSDDEFAGVLEAWFAQRNAAEALSALKLAVRRRNFFNDPSNLDSGRSAEYVHSTHGVIRDPGLMIRFSGMSGPVRTPAPTVGEHTDPILAAVGIDASELERLREAGVIR